jgi:hypothetical protein
VRAPFEHRSDRRRRHPFAGNSPVNAPRGRPS